MGIPEKADTGKQKPEEEAFYSAETAALADRIVSRYAENMIEIVKTKYRNDWQEALNVSLIALANRIEAAHLLYTLRKNNLSDSEMEKISLLDHLKHDIGSEESKNFIFRIAKWSYQIYLRSDRRKMPYSRTALSRRDLLLVIHNTDVSMAGYDRGLLIEAGSSGGPMDEPEDMGLARKEKNSRYRQAVVEAQDRLNQNGQLSEIENKYLAAVLSDEESTKFSRVGWSRENMPPFDISGMTDRQVYNKYNNDAVKLEEGIMRKIRLELGMSPMIARARNTKDR